jgi:Aspartyl protease
MLDPRLSGCLALPCLLALACSSNSSPVAPVPVPQAEVVAFAHITNLTPVEVSVGSGMGWGIVDTGDPIVELDPAVFPSASSDAKLGAIEVGTLTVHDVQVLASAEGLTSPDPALPLVANIGCGALCGRVASFNYRDVTFALGTDVPSAPSGLLQESILDFSFEGGKEGQVPRSRVVVTVSIEGTDHTMMLDTGATYITLDQSAFSAITDDGRKQLPGGMVETTEGESPISLTRVKTVAIGSASVSGVVAAHSAGFDTILENISGDAGETIEGSLGGTFLNHFYVTIDYPNKKLHLAAYEDHSFAIDPAENIGFDLGVFAGGGFGVGVVFAGSSAAAKGVQVGDAVVAIDGKALASLSASEAALLCFGAVGSTKMVQFGAGAGVANETVALQVDEFLPLP